MAAAPLIHVKNLTKSFRDLRRGQVLAVDDVSFDAHAGEVFGLLGAKMSTGMRQKVSIARAIIHDPPVLIFDEPTLGLDVLVARAVLQNIERLREMGKCVVFSTHIMREVEKLCDRVAIISRGRILAAGTLDELRRQHGEEDLEELFFALVS